jgi:hypothetical protein
LGFIEDWEDREIEISHPFYHGKTDGFVVLLKPVPFPLVYSVPMQTLSWLLRAASVTTGA